MNFFKKINKETEEGFLAAMKNFNDRKSNFTDNVKSVIYTARDTCFDNPEVQFVDTVKFLINFLVENQYKLIDIDYEFDFDKFKFEIAKCKTVEDVLNLYYLFKDDCANIRGIVINKAQQD